MRIRTVLTFGLGAATGAGLTYLADPDHGTDRRLDARRWAMARGREQATVAVGAALQALRTCAVAAAEGFRESRTTTSEQG